MAWSTGEGNLMRLRPIRYHGDRGAGNRRYLLTLPCGSAVRISATGFLWQVSLCIGFCGFFLFACFSEVVYNAFKYSDAQTPIRLKWLYEDGDYLFRCQNTFTQQSLEKSGSGKGLDFIKTLTHLIEGIQIDERSDHSTFSVEFRIKDTLLNAEGKP